MSFLMSIYRCNHNRQLGFDKSNLVNLNLHEIEVKGFTTKVRPILEKLKERLGNKEK